MPTEIDPVTGWFVRRLSKTVKTVGYSTYLWTKETRTWENSTTENHTITWSGQGKHAFHGCRHTVEIPSRIEGSSWNEWINTSGFSVSDPYAIGVSSGTLDLAPLVSWVGTGWGGISSVSMPTVTDPSLDWVSAKDALYADVLGKYPSDISVPLNVIEFTQLKNLVPGFARSLTRLVDWCKRGPKRHAKIFPRWANNDFWHNTNSAVRRDLSYYVGRNVRWRDPRVSLSSLQFGLKDLSSSYLAVQFGLKPLIDDVTNWVTKYYQLKLKADWFNRMASGKPTVFTSRTPNVSRTATNPTTGWFNYGYAPANLYGGRSLKFEATASTQGFGTLGCIAKVEPKSSTAQLSAMLASSLGVTAPLQTVWDIIPFSFVVDWVLPVGKTLQRADDSLFGRMGQLADRFSILRQWHSTKLDKFVGYARPPQVINSGAYAADHVRCHVEAGSTGKHTRVYERLEGWPSIGVLPASRGWSMFATATSAALILQRVLR